MLHNFRFYGNAMNGVFFALIFSGMTIFAPGAAFAQSLGDMMCSVSHNIAPFENLFVGLAYIMGSILIGVGLSQLAFFTDTFSASKQYGIARPKGLLIAGSSLLALPSFLKWAGNSLFGYTYSSDFGGGLNACIAPIAAGGPVGTVGLDGMMINLIANIQGPLVFMLSSLAILMGIFMVMRGLVKGSKFGQDAKSSVPNIAANIVIGAILYYVGTSHDDISATLFGDSNVWGPNGVTSAIASDFGADTEAFQAAIHAALNFVQLVGMIAFIRGWLVIRDAVEGQGQKTVAQGLTHVIGGALAINIYRFLDLMDTTFGTGFL